jgi:hypothetical protein
VPALVTIGKQGLVCFVGGTVVSIAVDSAVRLAHADTNVFARALGDIVAIGALWTIARIAATRREGTPSVAPAAWLLRVQADARSVRDRRER